MGLHGCKNAHLGRRRGGDLRGNHSVRARGCGRFSVGRRTYNGNIFSAFTCFMKLS